ncbi:Hypothetical predicted protein, partial [Olea europaea subsp. europaea]
GRFVVFTVAVAIVVWRRLRLQITMFGGYSWYFSASVGFESTSWWLWEGNISTFFRLFLVKEDVATFTVVDWQ